MDNTIDEAQKIVPVGKSFSFPSQNQQNNDGEAVLSHNVDHLSSEYAKHNAKPAAKHFKQPDPLRTSDELSSDEIVDLRNNLLARRSYRDPREDLQFVDNTDRTQAYQDKDFIDNIESDFAHPADMHDIHSNIDETDTQPSAKKDGPMDYILVVLLALVCAFAFRAFVAEPYRVPTGSMLETIQLNDTLIGEKVSLHFSDPQPGEVVTFKDPQKPSQTLIKRVIATGGQTVDLVDGNLLIDGVVQNEPYTNNKPNYPLEGPEGQTIHYPYLVPDGYIWVMGDNRTNSQDSRYFGAVNIKSVTSRARFIFWPLQDASWL